ncbi:hypothetical protein [Gluconacetobacter diazotrophicus]|uniref:Uncharacterized protein n=1 Tax=Gluconacetobacter diazotrophicus TaxID=33996 RepID=A0A7W4I630_GLUDI|nr:hypothetical protein [Gluconacetobacter diazotrophicus]MBB2156934.1 hypothetical protein [Gluconacetobacter diazotrophicus]
MKNTFTDGFSDGTGSRSARWREEMATEPTEATKARFYLPNEKKKWLIVDRKTGAILKIRSSAEIDYLGSDFIYDDRRITIGFQIASKYPNLPFHENSPKNPRILLLLGDIARFFSSNNMKNDSRNGEIFLYIFHIIAYANKLRPLTTNPYFWISEKQHKSQGNLRLIKLPSDDGLLRISESPLQNTPDLKKAWYHGN